MIKSFTIKYLIVGAIFGLCFPVISTIVYIFIADLEFSFSGALMAQEIQPLLWVINTAPFVIAFMASIAGKKQDELKKINELQEEVIDAKTKSLQKNNADLTDEIEQRKVIEKNLVLAKNEADEARHAEERFLANMSHEIRTPLNSIIGFTRLHADTDMNEQQNEYLRSVQYSSNHLLAIINDILELSKIKAGQIDFEQVNVGLKSLLTNVMDTIKINAETKGLALNLDLDSELRFVGIIADPVRMGQILLNLLNNALKFTTNGGVRVIVKELESTSQKVKIRFEVHDTGIGIAEDKQEKIFNDFTQAESSTTRLYGGTGLGLTITKRLIEMQDGVIGVESTLGVGSTFWFELEFTPCKVDKEVDNSQKKVSVEFDSKVKILLAEDNKMNQVLATSIFAKWGPNFEVDIANNGKEVIEKYVENDYDLILMDLQMPIMDGYTATEFIRTKMDAPKNAIPIIALTAEVLSAEKKKAYKAGMNDYLTKPFKPEELFFKIFNCVDGRLNLQGNSDEK